MRTAVQDHKNLYRIDGSFIVNEDDSAYQSALARNNKRRADLQATKKVDARIDNLEQKMDLILSLLQNKGNV